MCNGWCNNWVTWQRARCNNKNKNKISEKLTVAVFSVEECNKNGGCKFLRKTCKFLRDYMFSHPQRQYSSQSPHWETQMWHKMTSYSSCNNLFKKVKVKFSRQRPGVAQRVSKGIAVLFHDRGTRRGEWSAARPGRTLPPGKTRYPLYRRLIIYLIATNITLPCEIWGHNSGVD